MDVSEGFEIGKSVAQAFSQRAACVTFALIGSVVRSEVENVGDVDCLLITSEALGDDWLLPALAAVPSSRGWQRSENIIQGFVKDEVVSVLPAESSAFYKRIDEISSGLRSSLESHPWVIGGDIPEVILGDLSSAAVCFDRDSRLTALKDTLSTRYPIGLRGELFSLLLADIQTKLGLVSEALKKHQLFLFDAGASEILVSLIRISFILEGRFMLPLKHLPAGLARLGNSELQKDVLQLLSTAVAASRLERLEALSAAYDRLVAKCPVYR